MSTGEGRVLPPWDPDSSPVSAAAVGVAVGVVLVLVLLALVALDLFCCKFRSRGGVHR